MVSNCSRLGQFEARGFTPPMLELEPYGMTLGLSWAWECAPNHCRELIGRQLSLQLIDREFIQVHLPLLLQIVVQSPWQLPSQVRPKPPAETQGSPADRGQWIDQPCGQPWVRSGQRCWPESIGQGLMWWNYQGARRVIA